MLTSEKGTQFLLDLPRAVALAFAIVAAESAVKGFAGAAPCWFRFSSIRRCMPLEPK